MRQSSGRVVCAKLIVIGEACVGKTCLMNRITQDKFDENERPTIGVVGTKHFLTKGGASYQFEIWDTAGGERFDALTKGFFRDADAAIVAYDITKTASFDKVGVWMEKLDSKNKVLILVGTKLDLADSGRKVEAEDAKAYADANGMLFLETSAKRGDNTAKLLPMVAEELAALFPPADIKCMGDIDIVSIDLFPRETEEGWGCCG